MHDLLRWPFRSTGRLLTTLAAALVVLGVGLWAAGPDLEPAASPATTHASPTADASAAEPETSPRPANPESSAPPTGSSSPTGTEEIADQERSHARAASGKFVDTWLAGQRKSLPRRHWLRRLRPHTTPELLAGIRLTDPTALPRGRPVRVKVTASGAFAAETTVHLSTGGVLVLRLVDNGDRG